MAKGKNGKATTRSWAPKKTRASKRGNFPKKVDKTLVYIKGVGHKMVPTDSLLNKNFPPAKTGDSRTDKDNMQKYNAQVRADVRKVNASNSNRVTIEDGIGMLMAALLQVYIGSTQGKRAKRRAKRAAASK